MDHSVSRRPSRGEGDRPADLTTLLLRRLPPDGLSPAIALLAAGGAAPEGLWRSGHGGSVFALVDVATDSAARPLAAAVVRDPDERGVAELVALVVDPAHRGQGLGRRVLSDIVDDLRAHGVRRVRASPGAAEMAGLYLRAGFRPAAPVVDDPRDEATGPDLDSGWVELDL